MFNPIEMFQAQGGAGMQAMAQQFGLSPEQTARALEALMPALTLGIQRGAGLDPTGFAGLFGRPEAARAAGPQGLDALGQMLGSAQLVQAVLQQASAASGVGSQVLRQMLPMMAGAVVASIVHVMLNQPQAEPARAAAPPAPAFPFAPVWTEMARAFLPADAPQAQRPATRPHAVRAPEPKPVPKPDPAGADVFQQMFRTGAEVQGQNIKAMQDLFDAFWPAPGAAAAGKAPGKAQERGSPAPPVRPSASPAAPPASSPPASSSPAPAHTPPAGQKPRRGRPPEGGGP